jgi:hypothetical protein
MNPKRVLIDGVAFENTQQLGVQRYYLEMLRRLPDDLNRTLFFDRPCKAVLPQGVEVVYRKELFPISRGDVLARGRRKARRVGEVQTARSCESALG